MIEHAPDDFDWVAAHATCTASSMFVRLRAGISEDVRRRSGQIGVATYPRFEVEDGEEEHAFDVTRLDDRDRVTAFVTFKRAGRRILVSGDGVDVDLTLVLAVDPSGSCRYVIGEAMYAEWEVRRMALEQLFFEAEAAEE